MNEENNNMEENEEQDSFSNDPEEQLRIENELLRLKLQAETGAELQKMEDIPPEVENAFLSNILAFERQLDNIDEATIYQLIGEPKDFKPAEELTDGEIETELERLNELLESNQIEVGYGTVYPARVKYKFITEEFFEHSTQKFNIPDMVHHFIYEEFHPNHILALNEATDEFMNMWFNHEIQENSYLFPDSLVSKDGYELTRADFFLRIQHLFDAFLRFENPQFNITDTSFKMLESPEDAPDAFGHTEGHVSYDAFLENGDLIVIDSAFKLYFQLQYGNWEIMNIKMPGLEL